MVKVVSRRTRRSTTTCNRNNNWTYWRSSLSHWWWSSSDDVEIGISRGTIERIISEYLQLRKITARWVPNILTDAQRIERVRLYEENLAKFCPETWRLRDVVTDDESWFYHKQIGRKSSNAAWAPIGGSPPTVARCSRFAPRTRFCIFFKTTGPVLIHRGDTIDRSSIIAWNLLLKKFVSKDQHLYRTSSW